MWFAFNREHAASLAPEAFQKNTLHTVVSALLSLAAQPILNSGWSKLCDDLVLLARNALVESQLVFLHQVLREHTTSAFHFKHAVSGCPITKHIVRKMPLQS